VEDVAPRGRRVLDWLPPILWAAGLLILSAQPAERLPPPAFWQVDKLAHTLLYAMLGVLAGRALMVRSRPARWALVAAAIGLVAFGLLDEWSQSFTPGRMSSGADLVADALGGWIGLLAASRYYGRRHGIHPQLRR
jgi:VanZ family protein